MLQVIIGRFGDREIHSILTLPLQEKTAIEVNICLTELVKQDLFDIILSTKMWIHSWRMPLKRQG